MPASSGAPDRARPVRRKGEAQVGDVALGPRPLIDADQRRRPEAPGGLLQRLARAGGDQRLALVEVPGRLVEAQAVVGFLLDQQEAAVALDQRGDGDIGFPDTIPCRAF
jgi:hypothetical protein